MREEGNIKVDDNAAARVPARTTASDPDPCTVLSCFLVAHSITMCRAEKCCYLWMREARERREADKKEAAAGVKSLGTTTGKPPLGAAHATAVWRFRDSAIGGSR